MPIPLVGAFASYATSGAVSLVDAGLGSPFSLSQQIAAQDNAGDLRARGQKANVLTSNILPSPDVIYSAWRRGLLSTEVATEALLSSGITPSDDMMESAPAAVRERIRRFSLMRPFERTWYGNIWRNVAYMGMSRPSAADVARLSAQDRITSPQWVRLKHGLDADWSLLHIASESQYAMPSYESVLQHYRMDRIDFPAYRTWANRSGWTSREARDLALQISTLPTLGEMMIASWRGQVSADNQRRYRFAHGYSHDDDWKIVQAANRPMPGPADLVRFAVRDVWDHATAAEWGYDAEFPPELAHWMGWQGLDWSEPFTLPDGRTLPAVSWPSAYWRSHWQLMSPEQSYRAYRMLRPDRIWRYRHVSPTITPFTSSDLNRVLRVSDYPPKMRQWLAAISHVQMSLQAIRTGYNRQALSRNEASDYLQDHGYAPNDIGTTLDIWDAQQAYVDAAPIRAFQHKQKASIIKGLETAYEVGVIDANVLVQRLAGQGIPADDARRAARLIDAQHAQAEVVESLTLLRRAWLQGSIAPAQLAPALAQLGLSAAAQARYLRRWTRQRGLTRRMLSTSQLQAAVAQGALPPQVAALGLTNLGWAPADVQFLLAEAGAKAAQRLARDSQRLANQAKASQREKVRALRQAEAAARGLRSQLRSATPLGVIRRWYCLGIRTGPWVRQRLNLLGYDTSSTEAYLSQWTIECERSPHPEAPIAEGAEKLLRRQTPRATVRSWWQNGVVTDQWARQRLLALGYDHGTVERYLIEWRATLGKKHGPKPEPAFTAPEPVAPEQSGPQAIHQAPRAVHQAPRAATP